MFSRLWNRFAEKKQAKTNALTEELLFARSEHDQEYIDRLKAQGVKEDSKRKIAKTNKQTAKAVKKIKGEPTGEYVEGDDLLPSQMMDGFPPISSSRYTKDLPNAGVAGPDIDVTEDVIEVINQYEAAEDEDEERREERRKFGLGVAPPPTDWMPEDVEEGEHWTDGQIARHAKQFIEEHGELDLTVTCPACGSKDVEAGQAAIRYRCLQCKEVFEDLALASGVFIGAVDYEADPVQDYK